MEGKPLGPRPLGPRLGLREGSKGFGCGGVGGRGMAPELVWWTGRLKEGEGWGLVSKNGKGARGPSALGLGLGGGPGFGSGGVGGRGTGPRDGANFATCVVFLKKRKTAFFESSPVGWGRVQGLGESGPRALVPGG